MKTSDIERLTALENQIAATADDMRAPLMAALERLVTQAQAGGHAVGRLGEAPEEIDEDFFDNMPV